MRLTTKYSQRTTASGVTGRQYVYRGGALRLNVRLFQAEVVNALRYGCVTWKLKPVHFKVNFGQSTTVSSSAASDSNREITDCPMSYAEALIKTGCDECIEPSVRKRRLRFVGLVACMGHNIIPKTALLGEVERARGTREDKSLTAWSDLRRISQSLASPPPTKDG